MGYGVKVPPHNCLLGGLSPISLTQFFEGYGLFPVHDCLLVEAEDLVNFMEQVLEKLVPLIGAYLDNRNEVLQVDIYAGCG